MILVEEMFQAIVNFYVIGGTGIKKTDQQQTIRKKSHFKIFAKVSGGKRN
jgi:hypothetical protein